MCRKRGGVWGGEHEVLGGVYMSALFLRILPPEQKYDMLFFIRNFLYYCVSKRLPAKVLVRIGYAFAHGECGVEEEYALLCPMGEVSGGVW